MNFVFTNRTKLLTYVLMAIGLVALVVGIFTDGSPNHLRVWSNILIDGFFFFGIALGAMFFYALHFATETSWAVILRRVFEAVLLYVPYGAAIILIVLIASSFHWAHIYEWMNPAVHDKSSPLFDKELLEKSSYLNLPFFWLRTIGYILTFVGFAWWFRKRSLREDEEGGTAIHYAGFRRSVIFLVLFGFFSSTMAWDWIMSIDAHWFSTLFGWYTFAGMWVSGMNFVLLLTLYLISKGYLGDINHSHIHDMGKWVFALSFLWSYLWFAQFLLIWYANIPEEATYFLLRINHYRIPFFLMFCINFAFPMVILISRDAKRNPRFLLFVGTIILIGHWLDVYMLFTPGILGANWHFGVFEVALALGFLGFFLNRVLTHLTQASLEPKHSPYLEESLHFHI